VGEGFRAAVRKGGLQEAGAPHSMCRVENARNMLVGPSRGLKGSVTIPPNKSHSFRALIMAGLAEGDSRIVAPAVSKDWILGVEALERFGAEVGRQGQDAWRIRGCGGQLRTPDDVLNCGNSGIMLRFFAAVAACCEGYSVLTGDESLRRIRPCQALVDALNALGAWAACTKGDGHAPLVVRGRLKGGSVEIDGMDSQPVSALLIASSLAEQATQINVSNPGEKPWVGLTLSWLDRCGVEYSNDGFRRYRVAGGGKWRGFDVKIPLDWSAALYPIVAAVLTEGSEVRVGGMDLCDAQGDMAVLDVLRVMGADFEASGDDVVARSSRLVGREIDCNDYIDQFMLLAVVGARAEGETVLTNAEICRHKECDRIAEMHKALKAIGADVEQRRDGLVVRGGELRGAEIDSRGDHRMVMTLAIAALTAKGRSIISDVDCVKKTFPDFVGEMSALGCDMRIAQGGSRKQ
jgi:3-phosphoshikimate 1-carboxyvinyltransferase